MIVAFALAGVIFINFVFCWHEISNQEREIDALKDKTEELKTRVIFLEAHSENEKV